VRQEFERRQKKINEQRDADTKERQNNKAN